MIYLLTLIGRYVARRTSRKCKFTNVTAPAGILQCNDVNKLASGEHIAAKRLLLSTPKFIATK